MPNWITNRIRVNPSHFAEVKEILLDDAGRLISIASSQHPRGLREPLSR